MDAEKIVREFCDVAATRDVSALAAFFTEDAVYHNIPMDPVQGTEAISGVLNGFLAPASFCEFEVLALAVSGNKVLTERVDRFDMGGKKISLPVMGIFELTPEGKICAWRDYFDMGQFQSQSGG